MSNPLGNNIMNINQVLKHIDQHAEATYAYGGITKRRMIGMGARPQGGKQKYQFANMITFEEGLKPIQDAFNVPLHFNSCVVNVYKGGQGIPLHKDKQSGMGVDHKIFMINIGMKNGERVKDGTVLGHFIHETAPKSEKYWKIKVKSGEKIVCNGYKLKHSSFTYTSDEFDTRLNITFRSNKECH